MADNVELVRRGFEHFASTGDLPAYLVAPDFVWDMSHFEGWPEQAIYDGVEGARSFLRAWTENWEDWKLELEALHGAGDKVLAVLRQSGRSNATGLRVDMAFAQVFTMRDGLQTRMEMYADPEVAMRAVGLAELPASPPVARRAGALSGAGGTGTQVAQRAERSGPPA